MCTLKGYIMCSVVSGIVYPFTGRGWCVCTLKGYIMYSVVSGIVYPFTGAGRLRQTVRQLEKLDTKGACRRSIARSLARSLDGVLYPPPPNAPVSCRHADPCRTGYLFHP